MNSIGYIICETATTTAENTKIVKESVGGSGKHRVIAEGIVQTANEKNRNGRWYSDTELFPELTCARTKELIASGTMRGECGHPLSSELVRQQTIDHKLCCVKFLKFWTVGNDVWAQFKGTNNSYGDEFDADLRDGEKPAFSLRALGSVEATPRGAEVRNLRFITYDNVIYPSHTRAYTKGIVSESATIAEQGFTRHETAMVKRSDGLIVPINNDNVTRYIKSQSNNFHRIKESFDFMYDSIQLLENGKQIQLIAKNGDIIMVNLESYIHNEIMDYCARL